MEELVSVIIPVYNTEKFLKRSLNSIVNQTYKRLQIIIVDNCSTDNSLAICKEYAMRDDRIEIVEKTKNEKVAKSRNIGVARSRGNFIAFMDSDDAVEPTYIAKLMDAIIEYDAEVAMCCYDKYYVTENRYEKVFPYETVNIYTGRELCRTLCDFKGFASVITVAWGKVYRAEVLRSFRYDEDYIYEDLMSCHLWLYPRERVVFIPDVLCHWSVHSASWSSDLTYREDYTTELVGYMRRKEYFKSCDDRELEILITKRCYYIACQHLYKQRKYIDNSVHTQRKIKKLIKELYKELIMEPWPIKTKIRLIVIRIWPRLFGYRSRGRRLDLSY